MYLTPSNRLPLYGLAKRQPTRQTNKTLNTCKMELYWSFSTMFFITDLLGPQSSGLCKYNTNSDTLKTLGGVTLVNVAKKYMHIEIAISVLRIEWILNNRLNPSWRLTMFQQHSLHKNLLLVYAILPGVETQIPLDTHSIIQDLHHLHWSSRDCYCRRISVVRICCLLNMWMYQLDKYLQNIKKKTD